MNRNISNHTALLIINIVLVAFIAVLFIQTSGPDSNILRIGLFPLMLLELGFFIAMISAWLKRDK